MEKKWTPEDPNPRVERRLCVGVLNQHLICALCSGYLVDATGTTECLHRFCRSCLIAHYKQHRFCPVCDIQLPEGRHWDCLRSDEIIQTLVYKLVPGLYRREMDARSKFYKEAKMEPPMGEAGGQDAFRFFATEEAVSLSMEYYNGSGYGATPGPISYLKCSAALTVRHLKKFLRAKFELSADKLIDVLFEDECLLNSFSLMDIAYISGWTMRDPLKLAFRFYLRPLIRKRPQTNVTTVKNPTAADPRHQQKQHEYLGHLNLNPRGQTGAANGSAGSKTDESDESTSSELQIASDKDSDDEYHPKGKKRKKHDVKTYHMKRRKSEGFVDGLPMKEKSRRKSLHDAQLKNDKNEALKKVFSQTTVEPIVKKKKRKKSKHYEVEEKKRKIEVVATPAAAVLSVPKEPLKLKVKLTRMTKEPSPATNGAEKIDKERLRHLRSIRHKAINKEVIRSSPSLTISKVALTEQPTKPALVESKPSLEIMLVNKEKPKKPEGAADLAEKPAILDLSDKSTRPKEVEKSPNKSTQQSILQMAETLVNRQLTPKTDKPEQSVAVVAMRDLKTLSDAAVNILLAAKTDSPKPDSAELKIPMFPRDRPGGIPPVPNLHEIYPKRRPTLIPNQTVRHIPDPSSMILNRHNSFLQHNRTDPPPAKSLPPLLKAKLPTPGASSGPIRMQNPVVGVRRMDMTKNIESVAAGLTARANALIDAK